MPEKTYELANSESEIITSLQDYPMKAMRILLIGYYGKGNFGDDVLLKVTHTIVRKEFPDAEIMVLCDTYDEDYFFRLLEEKSRIIRPGNREHFDLIVHGGGGTFFDFAQYGMVSRFINELINLIGFRVYVRLDKFIRAIVKKKRVSAEKRLGWGIGIGTYSKGSKKLRHNIVTLLDFDSLVVRDVASQKNIKDVAGVNKTQLGSDLAFLGDCWVPKSLKERHTKECPKLGLVFRDWPLLDTETGYLRKIAEILPRLARQFKLEFFVFDRSVDPFVMKLAEGYVLHVWSPMSVNFEEYCQLLAQQDVIITSRAHGAICGAVLSVPSLIIEVEPKLGTIHQMLPAATRLVSPNDSVLTAWLPAIEELLSVKEHLIAKDIACNKTLVAKAVSESLNNV